MNGEVILRTQDELERGDVSIEVAAPLGQRKATQRAVAWLRSGGWPYAVYTASRLGLLLIAWLSTLVSHRSLTAELSLFDGQWYLRLAAHGYPQQTLPGKSTLGFLPLYPMVIRGLAAFLSSSLLTAALITALAGGLVAAVLLQRLAAAWWGERTARRAVLVFCLFPGAVVFSMAYSECLTLPLVIGCLLSLRNGRWLRAGVLAGLAGAVEPAALILIPVCLVASWREITGLGWRDRRAVRSLAAPVFSVTGIGAFAVYLWVRTGTPFASVQAQHDGWHQGDPLTLLNQPVARRLLSHPTSVFGHLLNFSLWNGLLGSAFLIFALVALARVRRELSQGVMLWTCGVGALTLWSVMSLTNARMLLIAFPAVIVWARALPGRRFAVFVGIEIALLLLTSVLTFTGNMLP